MRTMFLTTLVFIELCYLRVYVNQRQVIFLFFVNHVAGVLVPSHLLHMVLAFTVPVLMEWFVKLIHSQEAY